MDFFHVGLTLSLGIAIIGAVWRMMRWGLRSWRKQEGVPSTGHPQGVSPAGFPGLIQAVGEIIFLTRTARSEKSGALRWTAHTLLFWGFMALLIFHAMDGVITAKLFSNYEPTLNPWQWLRNLFGLLAVVGVVICVERRLSSDFLKRLSNWWDWGLLVVVAAILLSGFVLEASKILSPADFSRMVEEYYFDEESELSALKAYWVKHNGMYFPEAPKATPELLVRGAELHEDNCASCHAGVSTAFISRPLADMMRPAAGALSWIRADLIFYYLHITVCFLGLALLPFGKFFHPLGTPVNILLRKGRHGSAAPGGAADASVKQGKARDIQRNIGLDACTRCGECSLHCSVGACFTALGNDNVLPSEKLVALNKDIIAALSDSELRDFAEGSRLCTECLRCTQMCPSGIDLQELWITSKRDLRARGWGAPNQRIRTRRPAEWAEFFHAQGASEQEQRLGDGLADEPTSYWGCVQCATCTSVCPVVAVSEDPTRDLDFTPQQLMNMLRMGMKEQTLGARMVWSCVTCYKCQEHCPQGVPVADVLYELRNTAAARLREHDQEQARGEKE